MSLKLIYQLFMARNASLRELRETEQAIIHAAGTSENHNFVHSGVLALATEHNNLWEKCHELDRLRYGKRFWQVNSSEVSDRLQIAQAARDIRNRLWLLDQGLFNLLPVDFVNEVQAAMSGKRTTSPASIKAPIKTAGSNGNVHELPVASDSKRSKKRFAQPARILQFPRKNKP
jgi:hypothetical protein